jgi:hypothetical protein
LLGHEVAQSREHDRRQHNLVEHPQAYPLRRLLLQEVDRGVETGDRNYAQESRLDHVLVLEVSIHLNGAILAECFDCYLVGQLAGVACADETIEYRNLLQRLGRD